MVLLSIIIPTRNRQKYCKAAIEQILSLNLEDCEICIQDNSDDISLSEYIHTKQSSRLVYNYHKGQLSFVDNFSEAISLASGKYLCMIGDDDGILSNILNVVKWADLENYDCVIPTVASTYFWENNDKQATNSRVLYTDKIRRTKTNVNVSRGLNALLSNGGQEYLKMNVPRIYNGIVKRECIEELKNISGVFFDGLSPDIYIATALSFVCRKVCRLGFPITLPGVCPRSGSADSATGKHTGNFSSAPHFKGHTDYVWDKKVPKIYSVETIWADSMLHAIKRFGTIEQYQLFSVYKLDGKCLLKYPQFRDIIRKHLSECKYNYFRCLIMAKLMQFRDSYLETWYRVKRLFRRLSCRLFGIPTDVHVYRDVDNINEAVLLLNKILAERNCLQYK